MSFIDIVIGSFILFGLIKGFIKGFIIEVASLVALIAGVYGAIHFSSYLGVFLNEKTQWNEKTITITAFALTFIGIILLIALAGKALTKLADFAALGILNKIFGGVFGALKMSLILSVIVVVFDNLNNTLPLTAKKDLDNSLLYKPVRSLIPIIYPNILNKKNLDTENSIDETHAI